VDRNADSNETICLKFVNATTANEALSSSASRNPICKWPIDARVFDCVEEAGCVEGPIERRLDPNYKFIASLFSIQLC
jgi:hypothetical protein